MVVTHQYTLRRYWSKLGRKASLAPISTHPQAMRCTAVTNQNPNVTRRISEGLTLRLSRMSLNIALTLLIFTIFMSLVTMMMSSTAPTPMEALGVQSEVTWKSQAKGMEAITSTANQLRRYSRAMLLRSV